MKITKRLKSPTPLFFKSLQKISLVLAGISGVILTTPVALPACLISIAGYVATAGAVAAVVGQAAVKEEEMKRD
ncbi:hypothetical protein [Daejeonella oryzae]|uniref:hypothetical protein n=1 Tax=Daejeonella oryzae TaxID=1122943 RepID=UPI000479EB99|nr:hypothetical protein [Daejeonella oryzae]